MLVSVHEATRSICTSFLVHGRLTPISNIANIHLCTLLEGGTVRVNCLAQVPNTVSIARGWTQKARSRDALISDVSHVAVDLTLHSYWKRVIHNNCLILASICKCYFFFHLQLLEMKVEWTGKGQIRFSLSQNHDVVYLFNSVFIFIFLYV